MAAVNPPGFLQNAGATHTAEQTRNHLGTLVAGCTGSLAAAVLIPRGGVHPARGGALAVTQTGSPSMAVIVTAGIAMVPGSEGSKQGVYEVFNDADLTLSITAAHATLNRIDIVCWKVEDSQYSGVNNTSSLVVVTGTPAASPSPPTAPNNSLILAQVAVNAAVTSIVNANITDKRIFLAGQGGKITCTSTNRPGVFTVANGQEIYETDTKRTLITHDFGSTWVNKTERYEARTIVTGASVASVTFSSIPTNLRSLTIRWTVRGTAAALFTEFGMRVNNDATSGRYLTTLIGWNNTPGGAFRSTDTYAYIGNGAAATATAGLFGSGSLDFIGWDSPHSTFLCWNGINQVQTSGGVMNALGGTFSQAGAYNRLDFLMASGNIDIGSCIEIEGRYV